MCIYETKLQVPVKIATPNPKLASFIISQYGGPDGELGASMRYLSQRYAMPYAEAKGLHISSLAFYPNTMDADLDKRNAAIETEFVTAFSVSLAWRQCHVGLFRLKEQKGGLQVYFVDNEQYFDRSRIYGEGDDGERFAYFSKRFCVSEWLSTGEGHTRNFRTRRYLFKKLL